MFVFMNQSAKRNRLTWLEISAHCRATSLMILFNTGSILGMSLCFQICTSDMQSCFRSFNKAKLIFWSVENTLSDLYPAGHEQKITTSTSHFVFGAAATLFYYYFFYFLSYIQPEEHYGVHELYGNKTNKQTKEQNRHLTQSKRSEAYTTVLKLCLSRPKCATWR